MLSSSARSTPPAYIPYLDLLRILSCFLVIVNHTYAALPMPQTIGATTYLHYFVLALSKPAVPVFLMISGCTLLQKTDSIPKTLQRFFRIAAALLVFSFVYELYRCMVIPNKALSIKRFLLFIYEWHITNAYWYLYAYLGLLLMLPFLQKMVKAMAQCDFIFFFAISIFFFGIWPVIVEYTSMSAYSGIFELPLFGTYICYMLIGYYLHRYPPRKVHPLVWIAGMLLMHGFTSVLSVESFVATGVSHDPFISTIHRFPAIFASICLFCLFQRISVPAPAYGILSEIGRCTFGAYLLSDLFIELLTPLLNGCAAFMHAVPSVAIYQIAVFLASLLAAHVLRRIPCLRRLL